MTDIDGEWGYMEVTIDNVGGSCGCDEREGGGWGQGGGPGVNIEISEHPFISYMTQWLCSSIYWC